MPRGRVACQAHCGSEKRNDFQELSHNVEENWKAGISSTSCRHEDSSSALTLTSCWVLFRRSNNQGPKPLIKLKFKQTAVITALFPLQDLFIIYLGFLKTSERWCSGSFEHIYLRRKWHQKWPSLWKTNQDEHKILSQHTLSKAYIQLNVFIKGSRLV